MLLGAADPADALAVARVHIRAWQVGFSGLLPRASLDALSPEQRTPTTLVAAGREVLAARFETAMLWHLVGNSRAERFYRIDRWLPDGTTRTDELMGIAVDEVRFRRSLSL